MSETPSKQPLTTVTRRAPGAAIVNVASDLDKADIVAIAPSSSRSSWRRPRAG